MPDKGHETCWINEGKQAPVPRAQIGRPRTSPVASKAAHYMQASNFSSIVDFALIMGVFQCLWALSHPQIISPATNTPQPPQTQLLLCPHKTTPGTATR
eukprot:scaffold204354_cov19-Tisochrysis_lutea.AAC.1